MWSSLCVLFSAFAFFFSEPSAAGVQEFVRYVAGFLSFFFFLFICDMLPFFFFPCWSVSSSFFFFFHCDENESVHFCTADETLCSASMIALQRNYKDEYIYIYMLFYLYVYISVRCFFFFLICACAHGI